MRKMENMLWFASKLSSWLLGKNWQVHSFLILALSALFCGLVVGISLLASEKPLFFLHLELLPARQSIKLPSCDAKHRNKVLFREVILREKTKFLVRRKTWHLSMPTEVGEGNVEPEIIFEGGRRVNFQEVCNRLKLSIEFLGCGVPFGLRRSWLDLLLSRSHLAPGFFQNN